jgi:hypothetical protein
MRICLFEDGGVANLEPLTLTRPVFDLLCGLTSLGEKQCRHFGAGEVGVLVRPELAELYRQERPEVRVNDLAWLRAGPTILVNGRWLPPAARPADGALPCLGMVGDEAAYAVLGPDHLTSCSPNTLSDCLETWKATLPHRPAGGVLVRHLWDVVEHNAGQIALDFVRERAGRPSAPPRP